MMATRDEEMVKLKAEMQNMEQMFEQLMDEKSKESYDCRRTLMLKTQIIQLERQCMLFSEALSSRAAVTNQLENELISLTQDFQTLLAEETSGPTVRMSRKALVAHIRSLQKLQGSLHKQSSEHKLENLAMPLLACGGSSKTAPVTCLDVCNPNLKNVNLRNVAKLESDLAKLYKELLSLQNLLQTTSPDTDSDDKSQQRYDFPEKYLFSNSFEEVRSSTAVCVRHLEHCCQDLLSMSMLHPSAPWAVVQKPEKFGKFDPKSVLSTLPISLQKRTEIKTTIASMCKVHSYFMHMNKLQIRALSEQVRTSADLGKIQAHYMNCLLRGVTEAYQECERKLKQQVCEPVGNIMQKWFQMKADQSDATLREFLTAVKTHENALEDLTPDENQSVMEVSSVAALDAYGIELKKAVVQVTLKCSEECAKLKHEMTLHHANNDSDVNEILNLLQANFV